MNKSHKFLAFSLIIFFLLACASSSQYKTSEAITAIELSDFTKLESLLKAGLDPNAIDRHSDSGMTLLHAASALSDNKAIVELLIQYGADVNRKDKFGRSPALLSAALVKPDNLEILVKHHANINAQDNWGKTPLHHAVRAQFYLSQDARRAKEENSLKSNGKIVRIIKILKQNGANLAIKDQTGKTPMDLAQEYQFTDILHLFQ